MVCVLLKLKRPFTRNFWMNINDPRIEIPGLIEYSNLNPLDGSAIVYAPFYMPQTHPKYRRDPQDFIDETVGRHAGDPPGLRSRRHDRRRRRRATSSRRRSARPASTSALPPMQSAIRGLFLADTSHYYPEDRSISESLRLG